MTTLTFAADEAGTFDYMIAARLISPDTRAAFLVALGAALIGAPIVLGLALAAVVAGVVTGTLVLGIGLAGTASGGRGTVPMAIQPTLDQGLALGLLLSGAAFAITGHLPAALVFGGAGLAQLLVTAVTRYSAPPTGQDFL